MTNDERAKREFALQIIKGAMNQIDHAQNALQTDGFSPGLELIREELDFEESALERGMDIEQLNEKSDDELNAEEDARDELDDDEQSLDQGDRTKED